MPAPPVELDQVTCATPRLSCAVPVTTMELADVAKVVMGGERIVTEGAPPVLVLGPAGGAAGGFPPGGLPPDEFPEVGLSAGGVGGWPVAGPPLCAPALVA